MSNPGLTKLLIERLTSGELPGDVPVQTLGGAGRGERCRLCQQPVQRGEPEIELVWSDNDATQKHAVLHPVCHGAWLAAMRKH
jgi:hypothetical protein